MPGSGASGAPLAFLEVAAVVLSITACAGDQCKDGETRCRGRDLLSCERASCHDPSCAVGRGSRWRIETCEHACADPGHPAFCALSTEPDPRCPGGNASYCDGTDAVRCLGGFAIKREPCSETARVCVVNDWFESICALSSAPNAECRELGRPEAELCDSTALVTCEGSHVTSVHTCSAACVAPESGEAFCAAASEPDSRCTPGSFAPGISCPGDAPARCNSGYVECLEAMLTAEADAGRE